MLQNRFVPFCAVCTVYLFFVMLIRLSRLLSFYATCVVCAAAPTWRSLYLEPVTTTKVCSVSTLPHPSTGPQSDSRTDKNNVSRVPVTTLDVLPAELRLNNDDIWKRRDQW